ncbi:MAG: hypothetical protein KKG60_01185 [Nanoarchaeota archaeon]|nr:hypothetical protein [Nanoarchaeota archaeon]
MTEVVITYETLYELLRREKNRTELQKLDDDFFKNVVGYLKEKQDFVDLQEGKSTLFGDEITRIKKEIQNIKRILKEFYDRRELKILNMALSKSITGSGHGTENLLEQEEVLYDRLCSDLVEFRDVILNSILEGKIPGKPKAIKTEDSENSSVGATDSDEKSDGGSSTMTVRFLSAVPKFVGVDGHIYGPFENDDLAELPSDVGELLAKNERAEKV